MFDNDLDAGSIKQAISTVLRPKKKKQDSITGKGNIHNMIVNMSSKTKNNVVHNTEDHILADSIRDLTTDTELKRTDERKFKNKFCVSQRDVGPQTSKQNIFRESQDSSLQYYNSDSNKETTDTCKKTYLDQKQCSSKYMDPEAPVILEVTLSSASEDEENAITIDDSSDYQIESLNDSDVEFENISTDIVSDSLGILKATHSPVIQQEEEIVTKDPSNNLKTSMNNVSSPCLYEVNRIYQTSKQNIFTKSQDSSLQHYNSNSNKMMTDTCKKTYLDQKPCSSKYMDPEAPVILEVTLSSASEDKDSVIMIDDSSDEPSIFENDSDVEFENMSTDIVSESPDVLKATHSPLIQQEEEIVTKDSSNNLKTSMNNSNVEIENMHMETEQTTEPNCTKNESLATSKDMPQKLDKHDLEDFSEFWDTDFELEATPSKVQSNSEELSLPFVNSNGEDIFRFYWWDAYEDPYKLPGTVYLLGKVHLPALNAYHSCCLIIKNIPRRIYLLPRERIKKSLQDNSNPNLTTTGDVYKEFNEFANKVGIKEFQCREVSKYYAFELEGIPKEAKYLEVRYSAIYPSLDPTYTGPTIEHVFGTTVNPLELLLIERNIKGPCWLDVKCPLPAELQASWCKITVNCVKMENISVSYNSFNMGIPPMKIATLNIKTSLNTELQNEVVVIAILLHNKCDIKKQPPKPPYQENFCIITHPRDVPWSKQTQDTLAQISYTKLIRCDTEHELLNQLLHIIHTSDPDLLVGYDSGFQFDVLIQRMLALKVSNWSRIGRLKFVNPPIIKGKLKISHALAGRPLCDIQFSAKELNLKVRSYDLQSLCMAVLKKREEECEDVTPAECYKYYNTVEQIDHLIQLTLAGSLNIISIMFELHVIPLALEITRIAGNTLSRTLSAGCTERNEYLLLHAFHKQNYITPDRYTNRDNNVNTTGNPIKRKIGYTGGLVLEPKKGFYNKLILLMDFNSLYPSIIQEYNLCFTTVPGAAYANSENLQIPTYDVKTGIVPTEICYLVKRRTDIKRLMNKPNISQESKMQYNTQQMALKLTANSMYGCLGAIYCRFYARGLAALITAKGREILERTKCLVERLNYEVIYGDTDSLMINTDSLDYDEVVSIGWKIKREVNKLYKKVELDIDGVFRYFLLLQKKRYAALTMTKLPNGKIEMVQELKGIDIVRRDWCQLACETGKKILDQLFSDQTNEARLEQIVNILQTVSNNVREGKASLSSLTITKQLSKNPNQYGDPKPAHVAVALRLNKQGGRIWKMGDTLSFIICKDGTDKSVTKRAYHIQEYKESDSLKIDIDYYLTSQIYSVVSRICHPIEGVDGEFLIKNLGIENICEPRRIYKKQEVLNPKSDANTKFKDCIPLKFKCRNENCQTEIVIQGLISKFPSGEHLSLAYCTNTDCNLAPWIHLSTIQNALQLALRAAVTKYYSSWMECDNVACFYKTRRLPLYSPTGNPKCPVCEDAYMHKAYSELQFYNQMCYYLRMFDIDQPTCRHLLPHCSREMIHAYYTLSEHVEKFMGKFAYATVNFQDLYPQV